MSELEQDSTYGEIHKQGEQGGLCSMLVREWSGVGEGGIEPGKSIRKKWIRLQPEYYLRRTEVQERVFVCQRFRLLDLLDHLHGPHSKQVALCHSKGVTIAPKRGS